MKHLAFILAIGVLLFSTIPALLEDKCLRSAESVGSCQNTQGDQDCDDCCSPFLHCNTCTGFTEPHIFHAFHVFLTSISQSYICNSINSKIIDFIYPIWQPPQMIA